MIRTIIFDLGGVVLPLDPQQAIRRFEQLGVKDAARQLDSYTQQGIFGQLEGGLIDEQTFQREFERLYGRAISYEECCWAWQGYARGDLPQRNLDTLMQLRQQGYRVILLSNTNPFMMEWVASDRFDGQGHGIGHYFDALYLSYKMKLMKPSNEIFMRVLMAEQVPPSDCLFIDDGIRNVAAGSQLGMNTYCPENGADWTKEIYNYLK